MNQFKSAYPQIVPLTLTPALAKQLLANMRINRPVRKMAIKRMANQQLNNQWDDDSPQPIGFDTRGRLADGQHRCHSVILFGVTIQVWAALGMSEMTILKIDGGTKRTAGDRLGGFITSKECTSLIRKSPSRAKYAAATCATIAQSLTGTKYRTIETDLLIVKEFLPEMDWAITIAGQGRHFRKSSMIAALTLARYWANRESAECVAGLDEAMVGLISGKMIDGSTHTLHKYWMLSYTGRMMNQKVSNKPKDGAWITYMKSLRGLQAIMTGSPLTKIATVAKPRALFEWFVGDANALTAKVVL